MAALYGPLHGGANEAVLQMLKAIGSVDKVPEFIKKVKAGEGKLMGFGHRIYKNVDFYSGLIYQAMGFPVEMFPVLFAIPRTSGWLAQWLEMLGDPEQKISRPRQIYLGSTEREYVPIGRR